MFTVFKKWPRISKLALKSILLTVNLVHCRFKFNRYSYNSCTQPSKRQPHICTSTAPGTRMSVEGYLELLKMYWFIWVSCHLTLSLGWGADASSSKEFALRGIGEFLGVLNRVIIPDRNAAKNSEVIHRPMEGNPRHSLSVELGLWIPIVSGTPDSLSCSLDSKA